MGVLWFQLSLTQTTVECLLNAELYALQLVWGTLCSPYLGSISGISSQSELLSIPFLCSFSQIDNASLCDKSIVSGSACAVCVAYVHGVACVCLCASLLLPFLLSLIFSGSL